MAFKRRGGSSFYPRRSLPPTHESVRRSIEESQSDDLGFTGGMGHSPISASDLRLSTFSAALVFDPPPYKRPFSPVRNPYAELRALWMRAPARVRFCVQRKQRREVLFAKGRAGFRGSAPKRRYRRTQDSQYRC